MEQKKVAIIWVKKQEKVIEIGNFGSRLRFQGAETGSTYEVTVDGDVWITRRVRYEDIHLSN